jgi:hypothetical protein
LESFSLRCPAGSGSLTGRLDWEDTGRPDARPSWPVRSFPDRAPESLLVGLRSFDRTAALPILSLAAFRMRSGDGEELESGARAPYCEHGSGHEALRHPLAQRSEA